MKLLNRMRPFPKSHFQTQFISFLSPLFFILLADGIMAYAFPIVVEESLGSTSAMGFIIGLSSVAGIVIDVLFPKFVRSDSWKKLFIIGLFISLFFPLSMLLGTYAYPFIFFGIATIFWGGYFELITFSMQDFIISEEKKTDFNRDWAFISIFWQIATLIAPIIAILGLSQSVATLANQVIFFQITAFVIFVCITIRNIHDKKHAIESNVVRSLSFLKEIKIFELLASNLWVPISISFLNNLTIALIWDFGGLYGESISTETIPAWLFFSCYTVAVIIGSLILASFPVKKNLIQLSLISLLGGGVALASLYFATSLFMIFSFTFCAYLFFSIVGPLNDAIFSDLASRNKKNEIYLLSLHRLTTSITYVVTPIVVGTLVEMVDFKIAFAMCGVFVSIAALFILLTNRRHIRLPQKRLEAIGI